MRADDMGLYKVMADESSERKTYEVESLDQSNGAEKEKEKELDNAHTGQNKETSSNKQSATQEERSLNTETTFLYDSLLIQIDELLGTLPDCLS